MQQSAHVALIAGASVLAACADPSRVTQPTSTEPSLARASASTRPVIMFDACDPATFDAALGAGTCLRSGGMSFSQFIEQLTRHQDVGAWHFAPPTMNVPEGATLLATNRGGEVHTFTEVDEFGGGIVPLLNELSGTPDVAQECAALSAGDFVPPGGTFTVAEEETGVELYQCCIHPWMRTTVRVRER
ncbi:MAG TPA: hypothetical protein VFY16_13705 [Gemmatimonadaceae bacterium]|nr:hypothetical protein [Gemmatimonadaceae bacterium]